MLGSYNYGLVLLSISIAAVVSFTALDLAKRRADASGKLRHAWLMSAALAMGGGIWAMHFVGMLAFRMPGMEVSYDLSLTLASIVLPIGVTGLSFLAIGRSGHSLYAVSVGGVFMGLGIASMHYIGMAAMKMPAEVHYRPGWVVASLLVAIGASTLALWLMGKSTRLKGRAIAACVLGVAVSGMHYIAIEGAVFTQVSAAVLDESPSLDTVTLALGVAAATLMLLMLALIAAINDSRTAALREHEAKASLARQEQFRTLYSCTPLPLHALDLDGKIEHVSDAWLDLMGYGRHEVIGRKLFEFMNEASADRAEHRDWAELLACGRLADAEYHFLTKAGQRLEVRAFARVEQNAEGGFLRVLGGLIDDTKTRQVEAALRQSIKMEALGKLTSGISHDFNNILSIIQGSLELLQRNAEHSPLQAKMLSHAMDATRRGGALTQRLLSFARQQTLQPVSVSLADLVEGVSHLLQRSVGPDVRIETHLPPGLPDVYVDINQLEMVLLNLTINANDAMPDGGVLRIEASMAAIPEEPWPEEPWPEKPAPEALSGAGLICLAIIDTGIGMDEETLSRAPDPFFTTKGFNKGTGLGLSMAQGVAEQSGGRLIIRSRLGEGTRVELWLPIAEQQNPELL